MIGLAWLSAKERYYWLATVCEVWWWFHALWLASLSILLYFKLPLAIKLTIFFNLLKRWFSRIYFLLFEVDQVNASCRATLTQHAASHIRKEHLLSDLRSRGTTHGILTALEVESLALRSIKGLCKLGVNVYHLEVVNSAVTAHCAHSCAVESALVDSTL